MAIRLDINYRNTAAPAAHRLSADSCRREGATDAACHPLRSTRWLGSLASRGWTMRHGSYSVYSAIVAGPHMMLRIIHGRKACVSSPSRWRPCGSFLYLSSAPSLPDRSSPQVSRLTCEGESAGVTDQITQSRMSNCGGPK